VPIEAHIPHRLHPGRLHRRCRNRLPHEGS
jgi:hypothetical protein